jgi:hypothetical protein
MPNHLNEKLPEFIKAREAIAADIDNAGITSFL